jgi:hypothetical protein
VTSLAISDPAVGRGRRHELGAVPPNCLRADQLKNRLRVGAAIRAIPTTDFAIDDGGTQRLFGTPVGRVDGWFKEKPEEGWHDGEMRREATHGRQRTWPIEGHRELSDQPAARNSGTMRRGSQKACY